MDTLLTISRFVTYAAVLQMLGTAAFQSSIVPAGMRSALDHQLRPTFLLSALGLLLGSALWLMATAGSMGDGWADAISPATIGTVLTATAFGRIWAVELSLAAILLVLAAARADWVILTMTSAVTLATFGLVGHAAVATGIMGLLSEISQALHLLSSGFWLGALVPLLFCLSKFRDPALAGDGDFALRRFSGLGHIAVAVLLLTGVANSWFVLGTKPNLSALYAQLLLVKIGIAGFMCVLAIINRYVFVPRIPNDGPGLRQLARGTVAEIVLGAGILGLVSVIGTLSPG